MKAYLFFGWPFDAAYPGEIRKFHEIEIPDGAHSLCIDPVAYGKQWGSTSIPIPRPKIRKWIYEFTLGGITWRTVSPLSEEEYNQQSMTGHKVDETMIEVSE